MLHQITLYFFILELPWDIPSPACKEFASWKNNVITHSPWNKLDNSVLNLLKKILVPLPDKRLTATQILKHRWCCKTHSSRAGNYYVVGRHMHVLILG